MSFKHLQKLNCSFLSTNFNYTPYLTLCRIYCSETSKKGSESVVLPNDEEILRQALSEKEKDACVRSRLSRECKNLFETAPAFKAPSSLDVSHLNAIREQNEKKCSNWEDYSFDHAFLKDTHRIYVNFSDSPSPSTDPKAKTTSTRGETKAPTTPASIPPPPPTPPSIPVSSSNRITRQQPGEVIYAFLPVEWWKFFIPKTGVTGFATFVVTLSTYMFSKEIMVMEHNFYNGLSSMLLLALSVKYLGPPVAKFLDKEVDTYEAAWQKGRNESKAILEEDILQEKLFQFQADGQLMLVQVKRENVHLQREEEYRKRLMHVYKQVKRILDYHLAVANVYRRIQQKNLVQYVQREVIKSVTPEMANKLIYYSIEHIIEEMEKHKIFPEQDPPKGGGGKDPQGGAGSPAGQSPQGIAAKPQTAEPKGGQDLQGGASSPRDQTPQGSAAKPQTTQPKGGQEAVKPIQKPEKKVEKPFSPSKSGGKGDQSSVPKSKDSTKCDPKNPDDESKKR